MTSELENSIKDVHNDTQTLPIIVKSEINDSFSQINDEDVLNNRDEISNFEIQNIVKNKPVQGIPINLNQFSHVPVKQEKTDFSSECYLDNSPAASTLSDFMNESYDHFINENSAVEPEYIKPEDIKSELGEYSNDDPSLNVCLDESSDENNLKMRTRLKHILCCVCPFIGLGQREVAEHFNATHIHGKFFICPICNFKTKWRKSLIRHVVRHELRDRLKGSNRSVYDSIDIHVENTQIEGTSKEVSCKNEFDITTPEFVSVENIKHEIEDGLKEETSEEVSENVFNCTKPEFVSVEDIKCEIEDSNSDIVDESDVKRYLEDTDEVQDANNSHGESETIKINSAKLDYDSDREVDRTVCIICHHKCKNKADIEQHYKTVHMRDGLMICTSCDFKTKWKRALVRHVVLHDKDLSYKCPYCKFNTKQKAYLKLHIKHKHEESDIYHNCEYCSFKSKHKGALWRHQKLQHSLECTRYKCTECDFETKRKDHLSTHMISKHSDAVFKCPHCDFKTKLKYDIKKHVLRKHGLAKLANE